MVEKEGEDYRYSEFIATIDTIIPGRKTVFVLVGGGNVLFKDGGPEQQLAFVGAKSFNVGLVQLHYKRETK